jgi:hypothetical protein
LKGGLKPETQAINSNYTPLKTHNAMNKTVKTVLQILGYVIAIILGAAGEASMMV